MNSDTDKILSSIQSGQKDITIRGDQSLGTGDLEVLAKKILELRDTLASLTITNSGLTSDDVGDVTLREDSSYHWNIVSHNLTTSLYQVPTLTTVDLSDNHFASLQFLITLIKNTKGNPSFHTLKLSGNNGDDMSSGQYREFIKTAFGSDRLAVLSLPYDPWHYTHVGSIAGSLAGFRKLSDVDKVIDASKNIIELKIDKLFDTQIDGFSYIYSMSSSDKQNFISGVCERNKKAALRILDRVLNAATISPDDVRALNIRLPAVLYLAEQKMGREKAVRELLAFSDRSAQSIKEQVELDRYVSKTEIEQVKMGAVVETTGGRKVKSAASSPDVLVVAKEVTSPTPTPLVVPAPVAITASADELKALIKALPARTEDDFVKEIADSVDHLMDLAKFGTDVVEAVNATTRFSLHIVPTAGTTDAADVLLTKSLAQLEDCKVVLSEFVSGAAQQRASQNRSFLGGTPAIKTPVDAYRTLKELEASFPQLSTEISKLEASINMQLSGTIAAIEAYEALDTRLQLMHNAIHKVHAIWQGDIRKTRGLAPSDTLPELPAKEKIRFETTRSRVDFIDAQKANLQRLMLQLHSFETDQQKQLQELTTLHERPALLATETQIALSRLDAFKPMTPQPDPARLVAAQAPAIADAQQMIDAMQTMFHDMQKSMRMISEIAHDETLRMLSSVTAPSPVTPRAPAPAP